MLLNYFGFVLLVATTSLARGADRDSPSKGGQRETTNPEANHSLRIGSENIPHDKVINVGDIDNNGFADYVVANPAAKYHTGSLQLYLMTKNNVPLTIREITAPSNHITQLKPGDKFGSSVTKLTNKEKGSLTRIAVGAPGDKGGRGAVYVITLTGRGNVVHSRKLQASLLQAVAHSKGTSSGLGRKITALSDVRKKGFVKLVVGSASGPPLTVFMKPNGQLQENIPQKSREKHFEIKGVVRRGNDRSGKNQIEMKGAVVRQEGIADCLYSDSNCACTQTAAEVGSNSCMDVVGTEAGTGRKLCQMRDCEASYQCNCDGTEYCSREEVTFTTFVANGVAGDGKVYCTSQSTTLVKNLVLEGVPFPAPEVRQLVNDPTDPMPYNATNCRCSLRSAVQDGSTCLDFLRAEPNGITLCSSRGCKIGTSEYTCDVFGTVYCERETMDSERYVDEGDFGEPGVRFCRLESGMKEKVSLVT